MRLSHFTVTLGYDSRTVLFNTLTGAFVVLRSRSSAAAAQKKLLALSEPEIEMLAQQGLLVSDPDSERHNLYIDYMHDKFVWSGLCVSIVPSYRCNCGCGKCYQNAYDRDTVMPDSTVDAVIGFINHLIASRTLVRAVLWYYGGEPLLFTDTCARIGAAVARSCDARNVSLLQFAATNATLLRADSPLLPQLDSCYVGISQSRAVQAEERPFLGGRNSWDATLDGIGVLAKARKSIRVRVNVRDLTTLAADIVALSEEVLHACGGQPYRELQFEYQALQEYSCDGGSQCAGPGRSLVDPALLASSVESVVDSLPWPRSAFRLPTKRKFRNHKGPCTGLELCGYLKGENFLIDPKGDVYFCNQHKSDPRYRIGPVHARQEVLNHGLRSRALTYTAFDDPECKDCGYLPVCLTKCHLKAMDAGSMTSSKGCREEQEQQLRAVLSERIA